MVDAVNPGSYFFKMTGHPTTAPLSERCIDEAIRVISEQGLEALSLRSVARGLGVSHQAPYKHFESRDHLLTEVIRRCLRRFAHTLRTSFRHADAIESMRALGNAYIDYAIANPREYRLMFGAPWPSISKELGIEQDARAAFDVLCERLAAVRPDLSKRSLDRHAMYVWSTMHGIAGVLESGSMPYLGISQAEEEATIEHVKAMVEESIIAPIESYVE